MDYLTKAAIIEKSKERSMSLTAGALENFGKNLKLKFIENLTRRRGICSPMTGKPLGENGNEFCTNWVIKSLVDHAREESKKLLAEAEAAAAKAKMLYELAKAEKEEADTVTGWEEDEMRMRASMLEAEAALAGRNNKKKKKRTRSRAGSWDDMWRTLRSVDAFSVRNSGRERSRVS